MPELSIDLNPPMQSRIFRGACGHAPTKRSLYRPALVLSIAVAILLLSACATSPSPSSPVFAIDRSVQAKSHDSRVQFVVLHYTSTGDERSLKLLSEHNVSSHYLITNELRPRIYQLVDEDRRAWHAGLSQWYGRTYLNSASIGIEIVNDGGAGQTWASYRPEQISLLIELLRDIVQRHQIKPHNILGHSDIAPQRKLDPGPLFPWKQLAKAGLGRWPDSRHVAQYRQEFEKNGLPDISWTQEQLERTGYETPRTGVLDGATKNVIAAFQMHYRPARYDGVPDAETLALLKALP